jgi:hypothetical protein
MTHKIQYLFGRTLTTNAESGIPASTTRLTASAQSRWLHFFGAKCYDTTAEATYSGKYPIARYLYIYLDKKPNEPLDPLRAEFIKYILSKDGQTLTEKGGYFPVTNEIREHDLGALGISALAN